MHRSPKTALSVTWEVGTEHLPFVTKLSNFQNTKSQRWVLGLVLSKHSILLFVKEVGRERSRFVRWKGGFCK